MTRRLVIEVDDQLCVGSQNCVYDAPRTFEFASATADSAVVLPEPHDAEAAIVDAGRSCPQGAISVRDADTGEDMLALASDHASVTWRTPGAGGKST